MSENINQNSIEPINQTPKTIIQKKLCEPCRYMGKETKSDISCHTCKKTFCQEHMSNKIKDMCNDCYATIHFDGVLMFMDDYEKSDENSPNLIMEQENGIVINNRKLLSFYVNILGTVILVSTPVIIWIIILSYLPWTYNIHDYANYYNETTVVIVLGFAMITFGPIYITLISWMLVGKRILMNKKYWISFTFHTIFWITFYGILTHFNYNPWFYYLDFAYFPLGFLAMTVHAAYIMNPQIRFIIKYSLAELFVIVGALSYVFFLFPLYMQLSDGWKVLWRLFLHPIWFEVMLLIPQRVVSKQELLQFDSGLRYVFTLHSILHNVTIGRMLMFGLSR